MYHFRIKKLRSINARLGIGLANSVNFQELAQCFANGLVRKPSAPAQSLIILYTLERMGKRAIT
ncbi:hypothetical protein HUJ05_000693 [Dendroctonus ponderosae]|nr:hypothetical protein HUJ05_000693 [Dendroctonus ponderosae]